MDALDARFAVTGGSVLGREHRRLGRNNQDAFAWSQAGSALVAVVVDGCGSGPHSELGARLGARLLVTALKRQLDEPPECPIEDVLAAARAEVLERLHGLLPALGGTAVVTVRDHFLFTVLGAVVGRRETVIFSLGDGVWMLDGQRHVIRFPGNAPPYLGYALIPEALESAALGNAPFAIEARRPTAGVDSLVIGTDGAADLERAEPGVLAQLATDERYLKNPQAVSRCLARLNRERIRVDWQAGAVRKSPGRLEDDTTLILVRRRR